MGRLRNLKIGEFSIVRGSDKQPANPEAVALFYKAEPTAKEKAVAKDTQAAPVQQKKSLAGQLADAVKGVLAKAQTRTVTSNSNSQSTYQENYQEVLDAGDGGAAALDGGEGGSTTIVITDAVEKTAQPVEKTQPAVAADPIPGVSEFTKAIEPLVAAVSGIDSRLAKLEAKPIGSQRLKSFPTAGQATADDGGSAKFAEFTKFLGQVSQLSPGQKLTKATISSSGWTYGLSLVEAGNFIDYIVDQSVLLKQCRTIRMPNKKYFIDKIGLGGNVLVKGTPGTDPGDTVSVSGPTQIPLDAQEIMAIVSIGDDTLEDNIEGDAFVQHLLGMIGRSAANELEQAAIHADSGVADTGILDRFDGWYKLAKAAGAHVIEAMADTDRYWPGTNGAKATKVLKAIPTKYRQDYRNLAWLLHNDLYLDYNDELASKGYTDAWQAITGMADVPLRGIKNIRVPRIKTDMSFTYSATPYTDGTVAICSDLRNLIFGIHRDIRIEPFRQPRKRATDYVLSMRCAVNIENGDAIGIYDHAKVK
jgi:hypothetical protein